MPEAIKNYIDIKEEILVWNKKIVQNIIMSYLADMNKYTLNNTESVKIENFNTRILKKEQKNVNLKVQLIGLKQAT